MKEISEVGPTRGRSFGFASFVEEAAFFPFSCDVKEKLDKIEAPELAAPAGASPPSFSCLLRGSFFLLGRKLIRANKG